MELSLEVSALVPEMVVAVYSLAPSPETKEWRLRDVMWPSPSPPEAPHGQGGQAADHLAQAVAAPTTGK